MSHRLVSFEGPGSGDEPLSWGQLEIWRAMVRQRSWFPLGGIRPLPAGTSIEDIAGELSFLLGRYQSMRTRLRLIETERPRQIVYGSGEIALEIVEGGDTDPGQTAADVLRRYQVTDYDFENEWPVRMAVVHRHGVPTHQVSIFCHLVTDAVGGGVMLAEVAARPDTAVTGLTALDQARWQQTPAGERTDRAARRYWAGLLRTLVPPVATSTDRRTPRYRQAEFTSPAVDRAVRVIAERLRVDTPVVVLTLVAVALARVTGSHPVVLRPIVNNRFRPGLGTVVANIAQNGLCLLDVADLGLDEAVARTRRATMAAYKHAYFDPAGMDELVAEVSRERGVDVDVRCFYSDRRTPEPARSEPGPPRTGFRWVAETDSPLESLMWYVDDAPDALRFSIFVDTHFLSPADLERCVREVETTAVDAAYDPAAGTGTPFSVRRIPVPFAGVGSGDEPLSWGQQEIWRAMVRQRTWMPMGGTKELQPGTTVADIVAELEYLVGRHPTLRTRIRYADDGTPYQVVTDTGATWLDIVDAGGRDPGDVAETMHRRYRESDFDYARDWPIRMAVIHRDGRLTHQVTIMCHLAADASGAALMLMDVFARGGAPVTGRSALDQARWQTSEAGVRQHAAATRHWENGLRRIPVARHTGVDDRREPRHWQGQARSAALWLAVRSIVARTGADSGHVLLALWSMAYARQTARSPVALRPLVNNRFRRDLAEVVAPITQSGLCVIDVDGRTFDEVLATVRRSALAAYKHAYFDPIRLAELVEAITAERGPVLDTACFFNDRRAEHRTMPAGPVPAPGEITAALPQTTLIWNGGRDAPYETVFVHIEDEPDVISLLFQVDTHHLSTADMEACVHGMEAVAVEVASAAVTP